MIPRAATTSAALLGAALLALSAAVHAAPVAKQQCIASAESGQQLRSSGRLREARQAFGACTASACPAVVRRDCGRWIDEIDAATPSVIVKLEDDTGHEVADGRVLVDGAVVKRGSEGRASPLDPGVHKFVWAREDGNVEQELVIREGEHNRVVILRVPRSASASGPENADRSTSPTTPSPLPWVVGGIGLALVAAGGVFWGIGLNDRSNLESSCAAAHRCLQSDVDASHTKLVVGDVLLGVGAVAVVSAVIIYLTQSNPTSSTASR
jgi:hypothetical protein